MRNNFSDKLKKLDIDFNKMCALCQNSLDVTLKALSGDVLNVETGDELKQLKSTIEEQCVNMLLEESPVASDFRVIMAINQTPANPTWSQTLVDVGGTGVYYNNSDDPFAGIRPHPTSPTDIKANAPQYIKLKKK